MLLRRPVADTETYTVRYDSLFALIRDLRAMGMTSPLTARSRGAQSFMSGTRASTLSRSSTMATCLSMSGARTTPGARRDRPATPSR